MMIWCNFKKRMEHFNGCTICVDDISSNGRVCTVCVCEIKHTVITIMKQAKGKRKKWNYETILITFVWDVCQRGSFFSRMSSTCAHARHVNSLMYLSCYCL